MSAKIESFQVSGTQLEICWAGTGRVARYPAVWLRDHSHSARSMNPESLQQSVDTFAIPADLAPVSARLETGTVYVA